MLDCARKPQNRAHVWFRQRTSVGVKSDRRGVPLHFVFQPYVNAVRCQSRFWSSWPASRPLSMRSADASISPSAASRRDCLPCRLPNAAIAGATERASWRVAAPLSRAGSLARGLRPTHRPLVGTIRSLRLRTGSPPQHQRHVRHRSGSGMSLCTAEAPRRQSSMFAFCSPRRCPIRVAGSDARS